MHCVAQSIITLLRLEAMSQNGSETADAVLNWALANLWDDGGYFYYQVRPFYTSKTPFMRWGQAWMLLALASLVEQTRDPQQRRAASK